jgi:hypothetical protein
VFPRGAKEDPSKLMNTRVEKATIKDFYAPENIIPYIDYFVPELAAKLHPVRGAVISIVPAGGEKKKLYI